MNKGHKRKKDILLLEDDPDQAREIEDYLQRATSRLYGEKLDVRVIETESEFREMVGKLAGEGYKNWPVLFVLDQIVRWSDPDKIPERPPEVEAGGIQNAGVRCYGLLRGIEQTTGRRRTPVTFFSVAESEYIWKITRNGLQAMESQLPICK